MDRPNYLRDMLMLLSLLALFAALLAPWFVKWSHPREIVWTAAFVFGIIGSGVSYGWATGW